jgi:hypothetical protein
MFTHHSTIGYALKNNIDSSAAAIWTMLCQKYLNNNFNVDCRDLAIQFLTHDKIATAREKTLFKTAKKQKYNTTFFELYAKPIISALFKANSHNQFTYEFDIKIIEILINNVDFIEDDNKIALLRAAIAKLNTIF